MLISNVDVYFCILLTVVVYMAASNGSLGKMID